MKKTLLTTMLLSALATLSVRADQIWYDGFNYFNGPIVVTGTNADGSTNWIHTGNATASDAFVNSHKIEIAATGGSPANRSEDVQRKLAITAGSPYTNLNFTALWYASFTVNTTNFPNGPGTYISHFIDTASGFKARVHALTGVNTGTGPTNFTRLPNTYRLGISASAGLATAVFPVDLATNVDYQVVVEWDPANTFNAKLWINPTSISDPFVKATDLASASPAPTAYGFRQASSFGNYFGTVSNLSVATTFDEAATNVWSTTAASPVIVYQPANTTNFVGDPANLSAVANGQGLGSMTYSWLKNGASIANPNGNSNVFTIASALISDTGNYQMVATTPFGLSATSAMAFLWITNAPIPPSITQQPASTTVYTHQSASFHVGAAGPPPLTYQWFYNNNPATGANVSGADTDTIAISDVQAANGTVGTYRCAISNPYGTTNTINVSLSVTNPPAVSVAYLRTLVDTATFTATNNSTLWQVTGVVTTLTNLTTANTASYYLQDGTGGLNIFVTFGSTWRPLLGDEVTFIGFQSSFQGTLELEADTVNNAATSYTILSNNLAGLPAPLVLSYAGLQTNNNPFLEYNREGSIVMMTNVYFGSNAGVQISATANESYIVTNTAGQIGYVFLSSQDQDTTNRTLPAFAYSVVGPMTQNTNATGGGRPGYQVTVTRWTDIVTDAPPAVTITATRSTIGITTLSWEAVPYQYSYSVLAATDVNGPYVPVASGLTFTSANGTYTDHSYLAKLTGVNEVPVNASPATGIGSVVLSDDQTKITVNESWTGLTTAATASHIHGPAPAGVNAPVLFPFSGVPAATSGSIPQQTFAITPTQVGYLQSGQLYMNVHTPTFPGGEIRAQLIGPSSGGPTPAKYFKVVSP